MEYYIDQLVIRVKEKGLLSNKQKSLLIQTIVKIF